RKTAGPNRNRGCVALAVSPDLQQWKVREPFWAPDEYFTHECPDLFRIGDWWYLIYSTFTERCVTHYRMSRSLQGPWRAPENDTFDGRAYYAAKTAGGDGQRFIFGWLPTKNEEQDANGWQWGGDLVVHEVLQRPDGTLKVVLPKSVRAEFSTNQPVSPVPMFGNWHFAGETIESASIGRLSMLTLGELPQECLLETTMAFQHGTYNFGLLLRVSDDAEKYYQVRFEPGNQRVVVDRWPRPGDQAFMLERPVRLMPEQPINVSALISGSCLVVYVNDEIALSCRMYDHSTGNLGLFVTEGNVEFAKIAIQTR
ncbi:MAG TPA: GH32 C-terminal domain-containing protein, partial [Armatimonadota bacterium]|nr:GH32 C-terminal domain-containing protein [Armatimonadota bacterium]